MPNGEKKNLAKQHPILLGVLMLSIGLNLFYIAQPFISFYKHQAKFENSENRLSEQVGNPPAVGAWGRIKNPSPLSEEQKEEIKKLKSIGYLTGVNKAQDAGGVIRHIPERTQNGLNLFTSGHEPGAILMNMKGEIVHRWKKSFQDIWPERTGVPYEKNFNAQFWRRCRLFENGDLLVIFEGIGMVKLDKDSNVLWKYDAGAHHDLDIDSAGNILVLIRVAHMMPEYNKERAILEDFIAVLDPRGRELKRVSLMKCLANSPYWSVVNDLDIEGDIFHTNTLQWLDGSLADKSEYFAKGNILVSFCNRDFIGIVDLQRETFVWGLAGLFARQHQSELESDAAITIFDNRGLGDASRVLRFEPFSQRILWNYDGKKDGKLYSRQLGSQQLLSGGNILITESEFGRAFEADPSKKIVWEYVSPYRAGENNEWVAQIPEMLRIDPKFVESWLK